jgi:hypothetical protein
MLLKDANLIQIRQQLTGQNQIILYVVNQSIYVTQLVILRYKFSYF